MNSYSFFLVLLVAFNFKECHTQNLSITSLTNTNNIIQITCAGYNIIYSDIQWLYYASNKNTDIAVYNQNIDSATGWSNIEIYNGGMKLQSSIYSVNSYQVGVAGAEGPGVSILTIYPATNTEYYYRYTCLIPAVIAVTASTANATVTELRANVSASDNLYSTTTTVTPTTVTTTTTTIAYESMTLKNENIPDTSRSVLSVAGSIAGVLMLGAVFSWLGTA